MTARLAVLAVVASTAAPARAEPIVESAPPLVASWGLWFEGGVRLVPVKRLRITAAQHVRLDDEGLGLLMPELEVDYRIEFVRVGVGYRYVVDYTSANVVETGHRLHGDLTLRMTPGAFELALRSRLQWRTLSDSAGADRNPEVDSYWRTQASVEWSFLPEVWEGGPLEQFFVGGAVEEFVALEDGLEHDRIRMRVGAGVDLASWHLELYYLHDFELGEFDADDNVLGLEVRYDIDLTDDADPAESETHDPEGDPARADPAAPPEQAHDRADPPTSTPAQAAPTAQ
jgi:hypothetical protein